MSSFQDGTRVIPTTAPTAVYRGSRLEILDKLRMEVPPGTLVELSYDVGKWATWVPVEKFVGWVLGVKSWADEQLDTRDKVKILHVSYNQETGEILVQAKTLETPAVVVVAVIAGSLALVGWVFSLTLKEARVFTLEAVPVAVKSASSILPVLAVTAILVGLAKGGK